MLKPDVLSQNPKPMSSAKRALVYLKQRHFPPVADQDRTVLKMMTGPQRRRWKHKHNRNVVKKLDAS